MDGCVRLGGLEKQEEVRSIYTITSVLCTRRAGLLQFAAFPGQRRACVRLYTIII